MTASTLTKLEQEAIHCILTEAEAKLREIPYLKLLMAEANQALK